MQARIYQPGKNAMQSGRAAAGNGGKGSRWVLEYAPETPRRPEPLMGWTASGDTLNQVRLKFHTAEEAAEFAKRKGLEYIIQPAHERKVRPRNYADNFKAPPQSEDA